MKRALALGSVALLLTGGALLVWIGDRDESIELGSTGEIWADVLRDADQFGWHAARVPLAEEAALGDRVWNSLPLTEDPALTAYAAEVGRPLLAGVRRKGVVYRFHVVEWGAVNAFALPGGHIVVARGMVDFTQSEAELAAVLAHEISHVDLGHCAGLWRYELALKRVKLSGAGAAADLLRRPLSAGYRKYEEAEADTHGIALMVAAGYDPKAAGALFSRMGAGVTVATARTPLGEAAGAVLSSLGSYFDTHPDPDQRIRRIDSMLRAGQGRLRGKQFYRGTENRRRLIARSKQRFAGEEYVF
jgi:predicted Zn-dependent protease